MPDELTIEELQAKNEELLNNWKRTAADFENFKKRTHAQSREILEYAKEMTLFKLLPVVQSVEQILLHAPRDEKYKDWQAGVDATLLQLENTLGELGIKRIPTVGAMFDHNLHEAVAGNEVFETSPNNVIKQEVSPGFTLNGKVIIPAKVIVGFKGIRRE